MECAGDELNQIIGVLLAVIRRDGRALECASDELKVVQ